MTRDLNTCKQLDYTLYSHVTNQRFVEVPMSPIVRVALVALLACSCEQGAPAPATQAMPAPPAAASGGLAGSQAVPTTPPVSTPIGQMPAAAASQQPASAGAPSGVPQTSVPMMGGAMPGAPSQMPATQPGPAPLTMSIMVPNVGPGVEKTECLQVKLPTTSSVSVVKVHNTLSPGSHHFILTALTDTAATEMPRAECKGFRGAIQGAPLTITQKHDDEILLPEGIGYRLNPGQVMHLEVHYINTSDKALDIVATANLYPAPANAQLMDAAVLLVGTTKFNVPAHTAMQSNPVFLALPQGMDGVKFYAITGHTHRFGTSVKVSSAPKSGGAETVLYNPERFDWEQPEMKMLQPTATVPSGGGFVLQCGWNNASDTALTWGESATKEMCFFWGYYYPRKPVVSIVIDNLDPSIIKTL